MTPEQEKAAPRRLSALLNVTSVKRDERASSPPPFTPFFFGLPLHGWRIRVLHFEPIGGAAGTVDGILALRQDAFEAELAGVVEDGSPSLNEGRQRYTNCNHIFLRLWCPHGAVDIRVRGFLLLPDELYRFLAQFDQHPNRNSS
jgi:hypothetical protein